MSGILGSNDWTSTWAIAQAKAKEERINVTKHRIPSISFADLFKKHGFHTIELVSVDVEGAELIVLSTIDFSAVDIHYIVVEANPPVQPFVDLLQRNGFVRMKLPRRSKHGKQYDFGHAFDQLSYDNHFDIWFVNENWVEQY